VDKNLRNPSNLMKTLNNNLLLVIGSLLLFNFSAEKPTTSFLIAGDTKSELRVDISEIKKYTLHTIGTVSITNHKGDLKGKAKDMKGVLLKELLQKVELNEADPKRFSEFYFVCEGADGYKVVYSWNELFNTSVAQRVFIITQKDGKNMEDDEDGILMVSADDFRTGRRYLKNLKTITVRRAV
jgi:hypothetical protein